MRAAVESLVNRHFEKNKDVWESKDELKKFVDAKAIKSSEELERLTADLNSESWRRRAVNWTDDFHKDHAKAWAELSDLEQFRDQKAAKPGRG